MADPAIQKLQDLQTSLSGHLANQGADLSEASSGVGGGSLHSSVPTNKDNTQTSSESSTLAKAETLAVNRSKLLLLFVLALAAIGVGIATYIVTRASETREFETKVRAKTGLAQYRVTVC